MAWQNFKINKKFMRRLREMFGDRTFTNYQAYIVYAKKHSKRNRDYSDHWLQMNVRNNLCAMANKGILIRVRRGAYKFA